jgi:hypothetical protein
MIFNDLLPLGAGQKIVENLFQGVFWQVPNKHPCRIEFRLKTIFDPLKFA